MDNELFVSTDRRIEVFALDGTPVRQLVGPDLIFAETLGILGDGRLIYASLTQPKLVVVSPDGSEPKEVPLAYYAHSLVCSRSGVVCGVACATRDGLITPKLTKLSLMSLSKATKTRAK
jgi:hypothetical protein